MASYEINHLAPQYFMFLCTNNCYLELLLRRTKCTNAMVNSEKLLYIVLVVEFLKVFFYILPIHSPKSRGVLEANKMRGRTYAVVSGMILNIFF